MKNFLIIVLLIICFSKIGKAYEHIVWPQSFDQDTLFYRGQRTNLTSFKKLLEMLTTAKDDSIVTSRLFRTLIKTFPNKSWTELMSLSDQQVSYWKEEGLLWRIAECHADTYGCSMPSVEQLMGVIFKEEHLNKEIKIVLKAQRDGKHGYSEGVSAARVLSFFDPIVSTSYDINIAKKFAKDKNGEDGYTLILNDWKYRNCPKKYQETADCLINHEEYLEELEYPFWGYAKAEELNGFIVNNIKIYKDKRGLITITDEQSNKMIVELGESLPLSEETCSKINLLSSYGDKIKRLNQAMLTHFKCQ